MLTDYSVRCPYPNCGWRGCLLPHNGQDSPFGPTPNIVTFACPRCRGEWSARVNGDDVVPLPLPPGAVSPAPPPVQEETPAHVAAPTVSERYRVEPPSPPIQQAERPAVPLAQPGTPLPEPPPPLEWSHTPHAPIPEPFTCVPPDAWGERKASRSPVLSQMSSNPFRVLRLPAAATVDEAIWRAEEALTLARAGLTLTEPEALPWLPAPDEQTIRQAVQGIEEPLRRVVAQLSWFDFEADPAGEALRQALADLDIAALTGFLPWSEVDSPVVAANKANLSLLLAALALTDAARPSLSASDDSETRKASPLQWVSEGGLKIVRDPHTIPLANGQKSSLTETAEQLWRLALERWEVLLGSSLYLDYVKTCLTRLEDESVGADDTEVVVQSLLTRLTDLVAAEMKVQVLAGRYDRVQALLRAASASGIDSKQWILALRPLRPLFQTEVTDLMVLLGDASSPCLEDVDLYVTRLGQLARRWEELDPEGLLGLTEFTDTALVRVNSLLFDKHQAGTGDRINQLLYRASGAARANSVKQRITATGERLGRIEEWTCHYCRRREGENETSALLKGKKLSHITHSGNTTIYHYLLKNGVMPRCPRCADLHEYLRWTGFWTWWLMVPACLLAIKFILEAPHRRFEDTFGIAPGWVAAGLAVFGFMSGHIARWIATLLLTPRGEHPYWKISQAKQCKELRREGYNVTLQYDKGAFARELARSNR